MNVTLQQKVQSSRNTYIMKTNTSISLACTKLRVGKVRCIQVLVLFIYRLHCFLLFECLIITIDIHLKI